MKETEALIMVGLCILQNASFTLVSRARNSDNIAYHAISAVLSNGMYLLVFRQLQMNLDEPLVQVGYLIGAVLGSIGMHYIAMRFFEKKKPLPLVNSNKKPGGLV